MRKKILSALIGSAFLFGGAAQADPLILDLNGALPGGVITANALDWAPTSFLAKGGNAAIAAFNSGSCTTNAAACQFTVLTHAKLTAYAPAGSNTFVGLPGGLGEITMVASYVERVVGASGGSFPTAQFLSTGVGTLEFFWSPAADSNDLTGFGYNNGTLIGRLTGVTANAFGSFTVTGGPVTLDGSGDGDQYAGQQTVTGTGSQSNLKAGLTSVDLDANFFLTTIAGFSIQYENISIGLPYTSANPSDCFTDPLPSGGAVGGAGPALACDNVHQVADYAGQVNANGHTPNVGPVNGLGLGSPDFIAQTDYNSSVTGVPEPGSLALVGLALTAIGGIAARRRRTA